MTLRTVRTALLVALIATLAGELTLRLYHRIAWHVPVTAWIPDPAERQFGLSPFLVFGPRTDWWIPEQRDSRHAYFNAQGFRTPHVVGPKRPGELRVITLGGSTTEDLWNGAGIHWPLVAECRLHQAGRRDVHILNAAMSAYSSAHSLVRLEFDILSYQPDLVVVMHNINDLLVTYHAAAAGDTIDPNYLVKYGQRAYTGVRGEDDVALSRLWRAAAARTRALLTDRPQRWQPYDLEAGSALFRRNLHSVIAVARAHGVDVVLLTMPATRSDSLYRYTQQGFDATRAGVGPLPEDRTQFVRDFAAFNQAVADVGRENGVSVIPMHALMDGSPANYVDLVHYSADGTRLFGTTFAEHVLELLPPEEESAAAAPSADAPCDWEQPVADGKQD